jgi:putative toxin-antitoxin system antitoxin component (TIGR02293 family)
MAYPMNEDQVNEEYIRYESLDDGNILHLIQYARKGLSYHHFLKLTRNTQFSSSDWSGILHLSERTLQRYKKESLPFEPLQSERILEITLLYRKGCEVFGSSERFSVWLGMENIALNGVRPRDLLDNSFGIGMVKDELLRIQYGVLA